MTGNFASIFLLMMLYFSSAVLAENVLIVCNKNVAQESLSRDDIKKIFLGRKTRWADDQKIHFVIMQKGPVDTEFLRKYVGKTPSQFTVFWKRMIFTGKGNIPEIFKTPEEMLSYIANTPGAIGYIPSGVSHDNVKVLSVN